ncbi:hypothetical protein BD779DRAFT_1510726 [Infundibulicybe gibba]|nr:hypothetical protein BD779DRAFT_1510726 [Infundibulicybe gibba]
MPSGPPKQNPSDKIGATANQGSDPIAVASAPRVRAPCAFFLRGGCGRGEACNFAHIGSNNHETERKLNTAVRPAPVKPCRFYPNCRRAESCIFRHGNGSHTPQSVTSSLSDVHPSPLAELEDLGEQDVPPVPEESPKPLPDPPEDSNTDEYSGELPPDAPMSTSGLDDTNGLAADSPKSRGRSGKVTPAEGDPEPQSSEDAWSQSEGNQSAEPPWPGFSEAGLVEGGHEDAQSEGNQWEEPPLPEFSEDENVEGEHELQPIEDIQEGNQWAEAPWQEFSGDGSVEGGYEPQPIEDAQLAETQWTGPLLPEFSDDGGMGSGRESHQIEDAQSGGNQWTEPPWSELPGDGGVVGDHMHPPDQVSAYSEYIPHWTEYADPSANPLAIFCKFFAQGRCALGDACSFRHSLTVSEYIMLFRNTNPNLWSKSGLSITSAPLPVSTPGPPPALGPCLFYPLGKCRNGDTCPYDHIGDVIPDRPMAPQKPNAPDPGCNFGGQSSRRRPCKYFMEYGSCSKGEYCTFAHEDSHHKQSANTWDHSPEGGAKEDDGWGAKASDDGWGAKVSEDWFKDTEPKESASPLQENEQSYENNRPSSDVAPSTSGWGKDEWIEATGAARTPTQRFRGFHDQGDREQGDTSNSHQKPASGGSINIPNPINDDEETWNTSWDSPAPVPPMGRRIHQPCKYFGQGYCKWGNSCAMLHIPQVDHPESLRDGEGGISNEDATIIPAYSAPETTQAPINNHIFIEQDPANSVFELDLFGCVVSFGPKHAPHQIRTALQPRHIILSNLPPNVPLASMEELLGPSATITNLAPGDQGAPSRARVEYMNSVSASDAIEDLDGHIFQNHTIEALLDAQVNERHEKVSGHCVKLSWSSPSVTAWSYYNTVTLAKAAATKLHNFKFKGRRIIAVFQKPRRGQSHSFAIQITNLSVDVEKAELEALCTEAVNVLVDKPNYVASPNSAIRHLVTRIGPVVDFNIIPVGESAPKGVAIASYKMEASAALAESTLNGSKQIFLGGSSIRVQRIHSAIYDVPKQVHNAIKPDLDCLRDTHEACTIQLFDNIEPFQLVLNAPFEDTTTFGKVNIHLQTILRGDIFIQNGSKVWDNYFTTPSSLKALDQINGTKSYHIRADRRTESIHLFGSIYEKDRAKTALIRLLQKVHDQQYIIPLEATWIHVLLRGSLDVLRTRVGSNKILIDVITPSITVRGDDSTLAQVRETLDEVAASAMLSSTPDKECCLVCLHPPSSPMVLPCQHIYCQQCLQQVVQVSLELPYRPPRCIGRQGDCAEYIPRTVLHRLLTPDEENTLFNLSFLTYIRAHPNKFFFCPQLGCPTIFRTRMQAQSIRCPACFIYICPSCMVEAHPGINCLERSSLASDAL